MSMTIRSLLLAALAAGFLAAADAQDKKDAKVVLSPVPSIKAKAAQAMSCPAKNVSVKKSGTANDKITYVASGCRRQVQYILREQDAEPRCRCTRHCPDPNHPGGGTTCCEWDCS